MFEGRSGGAWRSIEAESVEDGGAGVSFNVFACAQPGVEIDYATGESRLDGSLELQDGFDASRYDYVLNVRSKRFHKPDCPSVEDMKAGNREASTARARKRRRWLRPCGRCNPYRALSTMLRVVSVLSSPILVYNSRHGERT
ncbi:MAG: hypothetical protein ACLR3C_07515 [Eggerthella lenta]